jgi:DNA repair protein RadC
MFTVMKVDYMTIPEITISYKDKVKASERAVIKCSADAARIVSTAFEGCMEHHEEVYVLFTNRANRVIGISCIAKGGLHGAVVDVRIILQTALKACATGIILSHNHPSGSNRPSTEDISLTKAIETGCKAIGIKLLDHLIVTEERYTSFADEGLL